MSAIESIGVFVPKLISVRVFIATIATLFHHRAIEPTITGA
jgi:hypothetical protein